MGAFSDSIAIAFFFLASVIAGPVEPLITAAPLVRRDVQTIGWYADTTIGGTTIWSPEICSPGYTLFSAASYYKCCTTDEVCSLFTGCSGNYLIGQNTQVNCLTLKGGVDCSYDLLYPSLGALAASTYFWCGTAGEVGTFYYAESPTQAAASTTSVTSITTSTSPSTTTTGPTTSTITTPAPPPTSTSTSSSSNAGAIAGGVVGGLAVIAIIAGLIAFFVIRNRKQQQAQSAAAGAPPAVPPPQTDYSTPITTGPVYSEKGAAQSSPPQPYYPSGPPQQTYPSGAPQPVYEQGYVQPTSPVPPYAPPEQRAVSPVPPNAVELESSAPPH